MQVAARDLDWDGCVNVRDLGGLPTEDGGATSFGAIIRADSVRRLRDDGWRALVEYGVARIVDLRWDDELAEDPPHEIPVEVVHIPLFGERRDVEAIDVAVREVKNAAARRRITYLAYLDEFRRSFAAAVAAVAGGAGRGVVVHCAGGVDRTGLVCALLLRSVGVSVADVARDWAASERNWAPHNAAWISEAPDEVEREKRRLLSVCPPESMESVLVSLEHQHGSVEGYLLGAGVARADVERVRDRLRR